MHGNDCAERKKMKMVLLRTLLVMVMGITLFSGCTQGTVASKPAASVGELPEPYLAKEEAKEALRSWQSLLESGRNNDFFLASMPAEVIKMSVDAQGNITEDILLKIRSYGPKLVGALSEAQFLEPTIEGDKVVFTYTDVHTDGGLFADKKLYLSKLAGRWFFNGPLVSRSMQ